MASEDRPEERSAGHQGPEDLTVRRSEEEARAGVRRREAGSVNVRKNVRTEREEIRVPKLREEVEIERVSAEGASAEGGAREVEGVEIGAGEEIVVPVYEEVVEVTKKVVLREEIRLRKEVVEDTEIVEVDLRKEEVEIDDQTKRGSE